MTRVRLTWTCTRNGTIMPSSSCLLSLPRQRYVTGTMLLIEVRRVMPIGRMEGG
jgi:hypothetical protein